MTNVRVNGFRIPSSYEPAQGTAEISVQSPHGMIHLYYKKAAALRRPAKTLRAHDAHEMDTRRLPSVTASKVAHQTYQK
jgi:hypothetical protein